MTQPKCPTCRFWQPNQEAKGASGICRRNAPICTAVATGPGALKSVWPSTTVHDYCGEHLPVSEATEAKKPGDNWSGLA